MLLCCFILPTSGIFRHRKRSRYVLEQGFSSYLLLEEGDDVVDEGHLGVEGEGVEDLHGERAGRRLRRELLLASRNGDRLDGVGGADRLHQAAHHLNVDKEGEFTHHS